LIYIVIEIDYYKGDMLNMKYGNSTVYQGIDMNTGKIIVIKIVQVTHLYTVDM